MKLSKMSKVDLELLSYTDLTELVLNENAKAMTTPAIFKKICELLDYSDSDYTNKIGDYYTTLTIDKRFILLDSAEWDLKQKYVIPLEVEEDEDTEDYTEELVDDEEDLEEEIEEEEEEENIDANIDDDVLDDEVDEDLEDLSIIDDEEDFEHDGDEEEEKLSD